MSSACSFCNKPYKSRNALIKHSAKCSARTENITSDIVEPEEVEPAVSDHDEASRTRQRLSDDFTEHARCDFKEQLLALSLQSRTSDENILVDAKAFDTLTRVFIGELFSYQHSQLKTIVGHNHVLAEENKMLISVLRSIVLMKHKDGSLGEYDFSSDEEEDASKTT